MTSENGVFFLLITIIICATIGGAISDLQESKNMKACVKSNGSWIRTNDTPYRMECRK